MASKQYDGASAWTAYENNCFLNTGTRPGLTGQQRQFYTPLWKFYFNGLHPSNCCFSLQTWQTGPLFQMLCFLLTLAYDRARLCRERWGTQRIYLTYPLFEMTYSFFQYSYTRVIPEFVIPEVANCSGTLCLKEFTQGQHTRLQILCFLEGKILWALLW